MRRGRQVGRIPPSHTDDWLITYADTITLLLCLFVVLLASQSHKQGPAQNPTPITLVEQSVTPPSPPDWKPLASSTTPRIEFQEGDTRVVAEEPTPTQLDEDVSPPNVGLVDLHAAAPVIAIEPPGTAGGILQPVFGPAAPTDAPPQQATKMPPIQVLSVLADAKPQPLSDAPLAQKGDRITTIVFDSTALFGRASATLNSSGKVILQEVVGDLKSEEYRDYAVTIEGHTDDAPISTAQFPSNWELSTARAAAVVRFFVEQGVSAQRLRAAGYADTRPLQPNRDAAGMEIPENQAQNRRVVIVLEKVEHR